MMNFEMTRVMIVVGTRVHFGEIAIFRWTEDLFLALIENRRLETQRSPTPQPLAEFLTGLVVERQAMDPLAQGSRSSVWSFSIVQVVSQQSSAGSHASHVLLLMLEVQAGFSPSYPVHST
jgi:hypothetical protein